MRIEAPPLFRVTAAWDNRHYELRFRPIDVWDGLVEGSIGEHDLSWPVDLCEIDEQSSFVAGMTRGSEALWGDVYWFVIRYDAPQPVIEYWGDRELVRRDPIASVDFDSQ